MAILILGAAAKCSKTEEIQKTNSVVLFFVTTRESRVASKPLRTVQTLPDLKYL